MISFVESDAISADTVGIRKDDTGRYRPSRGLTMKKVEEMAKHQNGAAVTAVKARGDTIEVYGAQSCLIHHSLSHVTDRRIDA